MRRGKMSATAHDEEPDYLVCQFCNKRVPAHDYIKGNSEITSVRALCEDGKGPARYISVHLIPNGIGEIPDVIDVSLEYHGPGARNNDLDTSHEAALMSTHGRQTARVKMLRAFYDVKPNVLTADEAGVRTGLLQSCVWK